MKPDKGNNNNKRNIVGLISIILWALVLTMLFRSCSSSYAHSNQVQVDYSTFYQWVEAGLVDEVDMESSEYTIHLKEGAEEEARSYLTEENSSQGERHVRLDDARPGGGGDGIRHHAAPRWRTPG